MQSSKKAFTLIDLMLAVVVIGILAAIAVPSFNSMVENARVTQVKNNMFVLQQAAEDFASQAHGLYPATLITTVQTVVPDIGIINQNTRRIADACPATVATVATTANALLPGGGRFVNSFLKAGNCLDAVAAGSPPASPMHSAYIAAGSSGWGTVYWGPDKTNGGGASSVAGYYIWGDLQRSLMSITLISVQ